MATSASHNQISSADAKYNLSDRAAYNSVQEQPWDTLEKMMSNTWTSANPDGLVFLSVAENTLLHTEVAMRIKNKSNIIPNHHLGYGVGPRGSPRLNKALVSFFNAKFRASEPVLGKEILILPGVVAVIDALAWSICNDGQGIIVPVPFYTGFKPAVSMRARGVLIPASFQGVEGYRCLDDIFAPEMNRKALENALLKSRQSGVEVRAVMLSNPHNPLGRCYPAESLHEIARFCGRNNLHLISDEIFAMSVYDNTQAADVTPFTSILALDLDDSIHRHLVHVAYGMGKDFGATGLRLGALHSRNQGLLAAVSSTCVFGWVPYVTQDMWADILEDEQFLDGFSTKSRQVLAKHGTILRSFLDEHDIPYYTNVHAGVFVWVDLRRYLYGKSVQVPVSSRPLSDASSSEVDVYRDGEMKLFKRCLASGVAISLGSSFSTEELAPKSAKWAEFYNVWHSIMQSPTEAEFNRRVAAFDETYLAPHAEEVAYIKKTWLQPYKEKLVKAWVHQHMHFGNAVTWRVEGVKKRIND